MIDDFSNFCGVHSQARDTLLSKNLNLAWYRHSKMFSIFISCCFRITISVIYFNTFERRLTKLNSSLEQWIASCYKYVLVFRRAVLQNVVWVLSNITKCYSFINNNLKVWKDSGFASLSLNKIINMTELALVRCARRVSVENFRGCCLPVVLSCE